MKVNQWAFYGQPPSSEGTVENNNNFYNNPLYSKITYNTTLSSTNISLINNFNTSLQSKNLQAETPYLCSLSLENLAKNNSTTTLTISLVKIGGDGVTYRIQRIQKIWIPKIKQKNSKYDYHFIFTPYDSQFTHIKFNFSPSFKTKITINQKIYPLKNVAANNFTLQPNQNIVKLGVQGPPDLLMALDGEPIRIGKNGIYELTEGVKIKNLYLAPLTTQNFIIDYQYQ